MTLPRAFHELNGQLLTIAGGKGSDMTVNMQHAPASDRRRMIQALLGLQGIHVQSSINHDYKVAISRAIWNSLPKISGARPLLWLSPIQALGPAAELLVMKRMDTTCCCCRGWGR